MRTKLFAACLIAMPLLSLAQSSDPVLQSFQKPPQTAKPRVWWHWMNGNITKEGIKNILSKSDNPELRQIGEQEFILIRRGWDITPENGESLKDCSLRVLKFIKNLSAFRDQTHLIVCHGNTIRAAAVVIGQSSPEDVHLFEVQTGEVLEWQIPDELLA